MKHLPEKILIAGMDYKIIQCKRSDFDEDGRIAEIDCMNLEIKILKTLALPVKWGSLLHEVTHAVSVNADIKLTESQVVALGNGLYQVLIDNDLMKI